MNKQPEAGTAPTPETDAAIKRTHHNNEGDVVEQFVDVNFARALERQRDSALARVAEALSTIGWRERSIEKLEEERARLSADNAALRKDAEMLDLLQNAKPMPPEMLDYLFNQRGVGLRSAIAIVFASQTKVETKTPNPHTKECAITVSRIYPPICECTCGHSSAVPSDSAAKCNCKSPKRWGYNIMCPVHKGSPSPTHEGSKP